MQQPLHPYQYSRIILSPFFTQKDFPEDLEKLIPNSKSIVYPRYETRGDLNRAVRTLCEWLEKRVAEHQTYNTEVVVCLLGHSMGGIAGAEAILAYTDNTNCPIKFIGLIAYDTPFFGVHKNVHTSGMFHGRVIEFITGNSGSNNLICSISCSR